MEKNNEPKASTGLFGPTKLSDELDDRGLLTPRAQQQSEEEIYRPLRIYRMDSAFYQWRFVDDRMMYLCERATEKDVLHVGCGDWPCTFERLRSGTLLHQALRKVARSIVGIDIEKRAIDALRGHGSTECVVADAEHLNLGKTFHCVIAGDVLEHVNNAGLVIGELKRHLAPAGMLVIAVPSALSAGAIRSLFKRPEWVHKDHTAYYSPKTLAELCRRYHLLPTSLIFTVQPKDEGESDMFIAMRNAFLRYCPSFSPSLIMTFAHQVEVETQEFWTWP